MREEHQQELTEKELLDYIRIIEKVREKQSAELSKVSKIPKPVALSSLRSPISKSNVELSEDNVKSMLDRVSNLIIRYGKEVMP